MTIDQKSSKILVFSIIAVAVATIAFWYYRDTIFSKEILKLEILGPQTAQMGDEISYVVKYKNNGNFVLEQPKLTFQLPDNSLTEDGKQRITQTLNDIYPGGEDFVKFPARLLGKEGDIKTAHAWLSYKPKNLSVRYESDTSFTTTIAKVPITLTFDLPAKIEKGKPISFSINYFSNLDYPLENISLKVPSVTGFTVQSSDPLSLDNSEWKLATLNKSQGGRVTIKGVINGDIGSQMDFSAQLGMWQDGNFIVIKETTQTIDVVQPLVFISQQINGSANYIASPGETLHYQIFLRNIGSTPFTNLFVVSRLDGQAFDLPTLQSDTGQVRTSDSLVAWDGNSAPILARLAPDQQVELDFTVTLKNSWTPLESEKNNAVIKNKVGVSDIVQEFSAKVNSMLSVSQQGYHSTVNGIANSGPVPPQVGAATSYAIVWQVKNYFNDADNVKVQALLPENATIGDALFPEEQAGHFSLDSKSRQITWSVGKLLAGATASITFQVSLTPSVSQQGTAAQIIGKATASAQDQSTGKVIQSSDGAITTALPDDQANSGGGLVQ